MRNSKAQIGNALDQLITEVRDDILRLVTEARARLEPHKTALMKQAIDTPHRARAQLTAWIIEYNSRNGAGSAQTFLASCLTAAGSAKTLASIDQAAATLETQALVYVNHRNNDGWSWDRVADAIEAQIVADPIESFDYARLPIPPNYTTVWGEPW